MTAHSSTSVIESASGTGDPDAFARTANDGALSAGFQSDFTIDEGALDGLLTAEECAAELDENLNEGRLHAEYRRLVDERAALRRVAALVAGGVEPSEVFDAVAIEMARCVGADIAALWRYETCGEVTVIAADYHSDVPVKWLVGTRTAIDANTLAAVVQRTGRPARRDTYDNAGGVRAARIRAVDIRAAVGVPIVVDGRVWGLAAVEFTRPGLMPADTETRISGFAELVGTALLAVYRDEQKRQMLGDSSRRPLLIDSLLEGRVRDRWSVWEVASYLRLPRNGPFVVVAAEACTAGKEALPEVESKLRSLDVHSAWRRLPDGQIGIVHLASDHHLDKVVELMARIADGRVGVSARFDDLRDAPQALHFARVTMQGRSSHTFPVAVFDGSILATAAVSAPAMMVKAAGTVLERFSDLPEAERDALFETFRVWQDNEASINVTAERLFCHPNTVRQRLRRIEKYTGRSLSRPRDVAELCLMFEVRRRLM
jgi:PucR C-terminal helix-turn-helix domain/GGDEF-like domain/GAF domain